MGACGAIRYAETAFSMSGPAFKAHRGTIVLTVAIMFV